MDLQKVIQGKKLTEVEAQVFEYVVEHLDEVMAMGVRGIARQNFTSTSTIMRLAKKLGYTGFIDMYYHLEPMVRGNESVQNMDMRFIDGFCENKLLEYNSYDMIRGFAQRLYTMNHKYIFIYATGFSGIAAEYMYKKFLVLGRKCILASGMDSVGVFENNMDDMGMFVAISKSGETKMVQDKMITAKENGIFTVSLTGEGENHLAAMADMSFRIEDNNKLDDRNTMANTFFPNVLMLTELFVYEYHRILLAENENR